MYAPFYELRFALGQFKELWIDNFQLAPLYPGMQYYIEVVDGGQKYYESSWLYQKANVGPLSEFDPKLHQPHFIISSETPLTVVSNPPAVWDNKNCN